MFVISVIDSDSYSQRRDELTVLVPVPTPPLDASGGCTGVPDERPEPLENVSGWRSCKPILPLKFTDMRCICV